jgi:flagellar hook-basal body complex protein FliE
MMRIELSEFPRLSIDQGTSGQSKAPSESFSDTLKSVIESTNKEVKESDKMALSLAKGENGNIHEAMIAMQKADINLRLFVAATNKIIEGYNQLIQLR